MKFQICNLLLVVIAGCSSHRTQTPGQSARGVPDSSVTKAPTTQPILYHRTGGIAGTDDRVVIWPDGFVQVNGKLLADGTATIAPQRITDLAAMFTGWWCLSDAYRAGNIMDAYVITIEYGGKSVTVDDVAPDLPQEFRKLITEIEAIAASASQNTPSPVP